MSLNALFPLVPRSKCSKCACTSTVFGLHFPPCPTPSDAQQACAGCNHKYWHHYLIQSSYPEASNALSAARGSCDKTGCGGFFPQPSSTTLDLRMTCICGELYIHHSPNLPKTAPTTLTWSQDVSINGNNRPVPQAALPLAAPPAMSQAVPHPPSQAASTFVPPETPLAAVRSVFSPFSPPVPSSLPSSQQRQVSASRHSGRASRSSFAYNQSPGPPGPNTTITPKTNKTSSSPESSKLKCAIIPFCLTSSNTSSHPTKMFQLTEEIRAHLIPCLAKSNLVFEVPYEYLDEQAAAQGATLPPAWKILDDLINVCLMDNNIIITPPAKLHEQEYYNLTWRLCVPGRNNPGGTRNFTEDPITWYMFKNFEHVRKKALHDPIDEGYKTFFVTPHYENLQGPVPGSNNLQPHPCWPWRVVSPLHGWLEFGMVHMPHSCILGCPVGDEDPQVDHQTEAAYGDTDDADYVPTSSTTRQHHSFVQLNPRPLQRKLVQNHPPEADLPVLSADDDDEVLPWSVATTHKRPSSVIENPRPRHRVRVHSPSPSASEIEFVVNPRHHPTPRVNNGPPEVHATPPQTAELPKSSQAHTADALPPKPAHRRVRRPTIIDQLPDMDISNWQRAIREMEMVVLAEDAKIKGTEASGLSKFMILSLNAISRKDPVPTEDVQLQVKDSCVPSIFSLLGKYPTFFAGITTGEGLQLTVFSLALKICTNSLRWTESTPRGYHIMNLSTEPDLQIDKTHEYRVDGNVTAIFMTNQCTAPKPISPFVILAASVDSIDDFTFDIEFARVVIPDQNTLDRVEEIFAFRPNEQVGLFDSTKEGLIQLATDVGAQLPTLQHVRPEEIHRKLQKRMLALMLVGAPNPWQHPDFKAFKEGFNCINQRHFITNNSGLPEDEPRYLRRFLATMYNRQIEAPEDVLPLIRWYAQPSDELSDDLINMFILRVRRWMSGTGHPRILMDKGLISPETYEADRDDKGLRARLFYRALTGSDLRLVGFTKDTVYVKITYRRPHLPGIPVQDSAKISVCLHTLTVNIGDAITNMLAQPGDFIVDGEEVCSDFDLWWHDQMTVEEDEYNAP